MESENLVESFHHLGIVPLAYCHHEDEMAISSVQCFSFLHCILGLRPVQWEKAITWDVFGLRVPSVLLHFKIAFNFGVHSYIWVVVVCTEMVHFAFHWCLNCPSYSDQPRQQVCHFWTIDCKQCIEGLINCQPRQRLCGLDFIFMRGRAHQILYWIDGYPPIKLLSHLFRSELNPRVPDSLEL